MSEKYVNYYIETLTNTLTDAFLRNVSLQANAKVTDEVIQEISTKNEELIQSNEALAIELENLRNTNLNNENELISSLQNKISDLNAQLESLSTLKSEYDILKSQGDNADKFRSELLKEREQHQNTKNDYESRITKLNKKIDSLEAPTKRKKAVKPTANVNTTIEETKEVIQSVVITNDVIKDGGSF